MRRTLLGFSVATLAMLAAPAGARISLPDAVVYGEVRCDGVLVTGESSVRFVRVSDPLPPYDDQNPVLSRARVGEVPERYVARIALEQPNSATDPRPDDRARVGDPVAAVLEGAGSKCSGRFLGVVQIPAQGAAILRNFSVRSSGSTGEPTPEDDLDDDAIPNFLDNCARSANASQADADGDGIGDACQNEDRSNPSRRAHAIGTPGNAADVDTGFGAVGYVFQLDEREVTNAQYTAFLRAVASEDDPEDLFNDSMATSPAGGIVVAGIPGALDYLVKPNMGAKPVNYVSWLDAARFANWIENGSPEGAIGPDTTETGAFDLTGADPSITAVIDEEAESSLPTEDEWYKAAYFDPNALDAGGAFGYRNYPTGTNSPPTAALADAIGDVTNAGANVANYESAAAWNGAVGNIVTTGDGGATSLFGVADMGGNVAEWLAAPSEGRKRIVRGGSFESSHDKLARYAGLAQRGDLQLDPGYEGPDVGLRLVPEADAAASGFAATLALRLLTVASRARRR